MKYPEIQERVWERIHTPSIIDYVEVLTAISFISGTTWAARQAILDEDCLDYWNDYHEDTALCFTGTLVSYGEINYKEKHITINQFVNKLIFEDGQEYFSINIKTGKINKNIFKTENLEIFNLQKFVGNVFLTFDRANESVKTIKGIK